MGRRNKSRFERWFSLSQHKRRGGAKELSDQISSDFIAQRQITIDGDEIQYTHGSSNDLDEHFEALKAEFVGQAELCYTHAKIIVLIRRDFETKKHFVIFERLWKEEKDYLFKKLKYTLAYFSHRHLCRFFQMMTLLRVSL